MKTSLIGCGALLGLLAVACASENGTSEDTGESADDLAVRGELVGPNGKPMDCADPAAVESSGTWYVYCTSMGHLWTTADSFKTFKDEHASLAFATAPASNTEAHSFGGHGAWWAPTVVADGKEFVMWVSVTMNAFKEARSLATFRAPHPQGPWTFTGFAKRATEEGQMIIDPELFRNSDGRWFVYWKQYGPNLGSSIMGGAVNTGVDRITHEIVLLPGYSPNGGWEDNVRENPTVREDAQHHEWHLLYSGNHWATAGYATGHALSTTGPLGPFRIDDSGDRGIPEVMATRGDARLAAKYAHGGPGGATWLVGAAGVLYAAASQSNANDSRRYLHRETFTWKGSAPFVDTAHHAPH